MAKVYISLGTNLGNRISNLQKAVTLLESFISDLEESIVLETDALLMNGMPAEWCKPYLNMVVAGNTQLEPLDLLHKLKALENQMGRPDKYERWAPRIIDLDVLLYEGITMKTDALSIPHPEIGNRKFLQHLLSLMGVKGFELDINSFNNAFILRPAIVGIVNVTNDSFSDGGKFNEVDTALKRIAELSAEGASIIDIGAQSTRPGSVIKGSDAEIAALKPLLDELKSFKNISLSIDTFHDEVVRYVINNYQIAWINDVRCTLQDSTIELIRYNQIKLCAMHSLSVPPDSKTIPIDKDPIEEILLWGKKTINRLVGLGMSTSDIILDPGIGFGKTIQQNLSIINRMVEMKKLGVQTLLGHSRKSYLTAFTKSPASVRDIETIMVSALVAKKVDFIRVHNVSDHMKALVTQSSMKSYT